MFTRRLLVLWILAVKGGSLGFGSNDGGIMDMIPHIDFTMALLPALHGIHGRWLCLEILTVAHVRLPA